MKKRKKMNLIMAVILLCIAYFAMLQIPVIVKMIYPLHYEEDISKYAEEYELPAPLVAAIIKTESNFDIFAESNKGAKGLMQITPSTGSWIANKLEIKNYNEDMLFDPEINIRFGCWYIRHLFDYYNNNQKLGFAAYNGGSGNVDKWLDNKELSRDGKNLDYIPFKETSNFVERVNKNINIYEKLYEWN